MLRAIERATRQVIEPMNLPTVDAVNSLRIAKFKQRVIETVSQAQAKALRPVVEQLEVETGLPLIDIAAALAIMAQGSTPLLLGGKADRGADENMGVLPSRSAVAIPPDGRAEHPRSFDRPPVAERSRASERSHAAVRPSPSELARPTERHSEPARPAAEESPRKPRPKTAGGLMETFRIEVGSTHGIKPSNIVGAIANEAGIEGVHIGRIDIREDHSFIDLPEGMPKQIFKLLQKVLVAGRELRISKVSEKLSGPPQAGPRQSRTRQAEPLQPAPLRPKPSRASTGTIHAGPRHSEQRSDRKMLSRRPAPARSKRD
jgi:ATP-dependent RNA helicase DeaD